jgi:hypothetical protein
MYKASILKLNTVKVTDPKKISEQMGLSDITYQKYPLVLKLAGVVAQNAFPPNETFGSPWTFHFKPDTSDVPNLADLETILEGDDHKPANEMVEDYSLHRTFIKDYKLNLKLKQRKDGSWVFTTTNMPDFDPAKLVANTPVTVTVKPGFYFSEESKQYGLYYTLKDITFEPAEPIAVPKKKRV